jgi:hypothetical protein
MRCTPTKWTSTRDFSGALTFTLADLLAQEGREDAVVIHQLLEAHPVEARR